MSKSKVYPDAAAALAGYDAAVRRSAIWRDLYRVRNMRQAFGAGLVPGAALAGLAGRISDQPRAAAHHHNRPAAAALQVRQQHNRNKVPHLQAPGRWVKAYVGRDGPLGQALRQPGGLIL